jgi:Flp pilus assembly protein TadB
MGKWLGILLAIMIACAVVGLLVSAVRAVAGVAFVVCLAVLVWQMLTKKRPSDSA